jgi:hypothetical protein
LPHSFFGLIFDSISRCSAAPRGRVSNGTDTSEARAHFDRADFASASQRFLALWSEHKRRDYLVWAGWSLERSQLWRGNIAVWEEVARSISQELQDTNEEVLTASPLRQPEHQPAAADGDLFEKLQLLPGYWDDPRSDDEPPGYYKDLKGVLKHQRAWALHWAAEHATAAQRHELAARLHRASGFAWAASEWGDKPGSDPATPGDKWRQAANEFFYSAMEAIEARLRDRKDTLGEEYEITNDTVLRGFGREASCLMVLPTDLEGMNRDRDRIVFCLREWAKVRGEAIPVNARREEFHALTKACEALDAIEHELARAGRRDDASGVHWKRHRLLRERDRQKPLVCARRWLQVIFFGCGARPLIPSAWTALSWLIIFPVVFWGWHMVRNGHGHATLLQTWLFSVANALTISINGLHTVTNAGGLAQVFDAVIAYVFFGATLFSLLRSFDS